VHAQVTTDRPVSFSASGHQGAAGRPAWQALATE
jgi:hypothetical protein